MSKPARLNIPDPTIEDMNRGIEEQYAWLEKNQHLGVETEMSIIRRLAYVEQMECPRCLAREELEHKMEAKLWR